MKSENIQDFFSKHFWGVLYFMTKPQGTEEKFLNNLRFEEWYCFSL